MAAAAPPRPVPASGALGCNTSGDRIHVGAPTPHADKSTSHTLVPLPRKPSASAYRRARRDKDVLQLEAAPEEGQPLRTSNAMAARGEGATDEMAARGEGAKDVLQSGAASEEGQPPRTSNEMAARGEDVKDVLQLGAAPEEGQPPRTSNEVAARGEGATDALQLSAAPEEGQPPRASHEIAALGGGAADPTSACGADTLSSYRSRRRRARRAARPTNAGGGGEGGSDHGAAEAMAVAPAARRANAAGGGGGGGSGRGAAETLAVAPAEGRDASDDAPAQDWEALERLIARQQEHLGPALNELNSTGKKARHWAWWGLPTRIAGLSEQ